MTEEQRDAVLDQVPAAWSAEDQVVSFATVCELAGVGPTIVRASLGDEHDLVDAWYARLLGRVAAAAREMEADTPQDLEQRIGARMFMLFDALEESPEFVQGTYDRRAACWGSVFRDRVGDELDYVLAAGDVPGVNRVIATASPVRLALVEAFVRTISLWLEDPSPSRERATAFVDRLVSFFAGLASDRTLERGIDLVRYAAGAGYIPFVQDWFGTSKEGA